MHNLQSNRKILNALLRYLLLFFSAVAFVSAFTASSAENKLIETSPEPTLPAEFSRFSNSRTVMLLSALLHKEQSIQSPLLRERIITDLGRTNNYRALPEIRKCMNDEDWRVRTAAVNAIGNFPADQIGGDLLNALSDQDKRVAAAAVQAARQKKYFQATEEMKKLLARNDLYLKRDVLKTLAEFKVPLSETDLLDHFKDNSVLVRIAALSCAETIRNPSPALVQAVYEAAGDARAEPVLRSRALALYGKLAGSKADVLLTQAAKDPDWRIRAGAAEGLRYAGSKSYLITMLDDESGPVRLAASLSVQQTKDSRASEKLWHILDNDPIEKNRAAAREALVLNDNPEIAVQAAQRLREYGQTLLDIKAPRRLGSGRARILDDTEEKRIARRRASDASYILGGLRSSEEFDFHLSLITSLSESDELLEQAALSLGQIGNQESLPVLLDYLDHGLITAAEYYRTMRNKEGPTVVFRENIFANVIKAIGLIKPEAGLEKFRAVNSFIETGSRMQESNFAVVEILAQNPQAFPVDYADEVLGRIISDDTYSRRTRWMAAYTAGKLKCDGQTCAAALDKMLNQERLCLEFIRVSSWAIGQITGSTPPMPDPVTDNPEGLILQDITEETGS